jgi:4-amino-4-deoxy-L-arabinose transferase-like glycosyltransferase
MYALFMLLVTLSVWAQLRALRSNSWPAWTAHGVLCAAMVYTQYFTILVILAQQLVTGAVVVARLRRREPVRGLVGGWSLSVAVALLLVLPLVPFAVHQYEIKRAVGSGVRPPPAHTKCANQVRGFRHTSSSPTFSGRSGATTRQQS